MQSNPFSTQFDAVIIGGSYAGLAAAMQLARARRKVLIIDAGVRRNRFASASHGFLGQDGRAPDVIAAQARAEVLAYPTVQWLTASAVNATGEQGNFIVATDTDETVHARRLVLATGVIDELPMIEGLAARWGQSVFHCPYCHGYEMEEGNIGVVASGPLAIHHGLMLPDWGTVTLFTNDVFTPDADQLASLQRRGVTIVPGQISAITDIATVVLDDGRTFVMDGLFTQTRTHIASPVAEQLGCAFDEGPMGLFIRTTPTKETTIPGVFACGDAARAAGSVSLAVGDGAMAGASTHQSILFR